MRKICTQNYKYGIKPFFKIQNLIKHNKTTYNTRNRNHFVLLLEIFYLTFAPRKLGGRTVIMLLGKSNFYGHNGNGY